MGATPPEEIAKQHEEAVALIEARMPCAPRTDHGEVPLYWKARPTRPNPIVISGGDRTNGSTNGSTNENTNESTNESTNGSTNGSSNRGTNGCSEPIQNGSKNSKNGISVESPTNESVEVNVVIPDWCISSRAQVDVAPIVDLIKEGVNDPARPPAVETNPINGKHSNKKSNGNFLSKKRSIAKANSKSYSRSNYWDETNASKNNVRITRPSHDAWGIKKIILVFCDDFLHTIYTLPWFSSSNPTGRRIRAAVRPVLDALQISDDCIVRCLLAGLPPGVTIPVHHDTGEWVKHTHRVHVPVVVPDPDQVLFRCGPTEQSMQRIDCSPGHVFEMNNQAKHAVTNAHPSLFRVHLILDYVSPSFFDSVKPPTRRVELSPGEVLTQTRRSIDRASEAGTRPTPSFLILGAQKAGTTSLYEYLNQHPWIIRPKRRETHCFDWRWDPALNSTEERRQHCLSFYHGKVLEPYPSLRTGDSTPSYLLDYYRVIPRLKECFDHGPKLIVLTREPIARAASHYAMVTSLDGTPEQIAVRGTEWRNLTLEQVIWKDIQCMKLDGLLPYWDMETKTVNMDLFFSFIDSQEEDEAWERYVRTRIPLNTGSYSPVARGLYALQCRQWFRSFPRQTFLVLKLEDMMENGVQWVVDRALEHLELPRFEVPDVEKKNSRIYDDPLDMNAKAWLQRFFAPHNERFGKLIVEELGYSKKDWSDLWSYS